MSIYFYDNNEIKENNCKHVYIDRIYCFDFSKFNETHWINLSKLYKILPRQVIKVDIEQQMWYGEEEVSEFYLWSSAEPSGLQVCGYLKVDYWNRWEEVFNKNLENFPFYKLED